MFGIELGRLRKVKTVEISEGSVTMFAVDTIDGIAKEFSVLVEINENTVSDVSFKKDSAEVVEKAKELKKTPLATMIEMAENEFDLRSRHLKDFFENRSKPALIGVLENKIFNIELNIIAEYLAEKGYDAVSDEGRKVTFANNESGDKISVKRPKSPTNEEPVFKIKVKKIGTDKMKYKVKLTELSNKIMELV